MNKRKFTAKANRKSIDELETQLIELNIEFFVAFKYLKESIYTVSSQEQKILKHYKMKFK